MSYHKVDNLPLEVAERIHQRRKEGVGWADISAEFDLSPPRAKMLLARHGLQHNPLGGARSAAERWSRPCIKCGSTERRMKGLFRCGRCRLRASTELNANDAMYHGSSVGGA